jgi:hypothetical protein
MATPRVPREPDTVYNRRESAGPGYAEGALWEDVVSPLIPRALMLPWMSRDEIREIPTPLTQIMRFPPRHGYTQGQPTIEDVLSVRRWHIPYAPVGQDSSGGAIATSMPSQQQTWY